ncbi:MAG: tRNA (adenosine(37)-N6)-threonylcarbamoyltransferase complex dimerization subunit type 1 TsaB [Spirochaetaceae bacterium]
MSTSILAFDTSGSVLDIAFVHGAEMWSTSLDVGRAQGEAVGPALRDILDEAHAGISDLSAVVVPRGPGSFTGLRIAIAFAKGLEAASGVPVFAADTHRAMTRAAADNREPPKAVAALIDGRKQRYFAALDEILDDGTYRRVFGPVDEDAATLHSRLEEFRRSLDMPCGGETEGKDLVLVGDPMPGRDWVSFPQPQPVSGVAQALIRMYQQGDPLLFRLGETEGPNYFRVSQAEEASL